MAEINETKEVFLAIPLDARLDYLWELDKDKIIKADYGDSQVWLGVALKYFEDGLDLGVSAEEFFKQDVSEVDYRVSDGLGYQGAILSINPSLWIDTHNFKICASVGDSYSLEKVSSMEAALNGEHVLSKLLLGLDKIAQQNYTEKLEEITVERDTAMAKDRKNNIPTTNA